MGIPSMPQNHALRKIQNGIDASVNLTACVFCVAQSLDANTCGNQTAALRFLADRLNSITSQIYEALESLSDSTHSPAA